MAIPALSCDDYQRQFPAAAKALAMHEELRTLLRADAPAPAGAATLDAAAVEQAWQSGRPVVDRIQFGPSTAPLRRILTQVTGVLKTHLPDLGPLERLADPAAVDDATLLRLVQGTMSESSTVLAEGTQATGAHPTGTAFALAFAVSVFFHAARRHLPTDVDLQVWQRQTCPLCAATPSIATVVADNRRLAYCHRCSSEWSVPADLCLACGRQDGHSRLRLEMPGDAARFAEVCRHCQQHTKLVDQVRLGARPDLYLEDVITLPLDQLAREAAVRSEEPILAGAR